MTLDIYEQKMLDSWESVYKKGLLTFWILLSLTRGPKDTKSIKEFVQIHSNDTIATQDQSLYRALRRFTKSRLISYEKTAGNAGPDKKVYSLTDEGRRILESFIERNIEQVFYKPSIKKTINKKGWL